VNGYCGFADQPACEVLAMTGGDVATIIALSVIAVGLVALGIAGIRGER